MDLGSQLAAFESFLGSHYYKRIAKSPLGQDDAAQASLEGALNRAESLLARPVLWKIYHCLGMPADKRGGQAASRRYLNQAPSRT